MDPSSCILYIFFLFCSGYCACSETAYTAVSKVRLRTMADKGNKQAKKALWVCDRFDKTLTTILIGNNVFHAACASLSALLIMRQFDQEYVVYGTLLTTLIGVFYSNVTPAATGGQPMQLVCLNKRQVPSGISASALTVKFFCFQAALLGLGAVMWALHPHLVQAHIGAERWLIYIGFAINALAVLGVLMLAINRRLVEKIAGLNFKAYMERI